MKQTRSKIKTKKEISNNGQQRKSSKKVRNSR
jgi:hypothetical protein